MKRKRLLVIGLFIYLFIWLFSPPARAMSGETYSIDTQSTDIEPFHAISPTIPLPQNKQTVKEPHYTILKTPTTFRFGISQNIVDFSKLSATNPVVRTLHLSIKSSQPYEIIASENHPPLMGQNTFIPDTTCDNGSCSEITDAPWTNTLTYGFGYRTEVMPKDAYKQFADTLKREKPTSIYRSNNDTDIKLFYKINISGTQKTGSYTNTVTYIAMPSL